MDKKLVLTAIIFFILGGIIIYLLISSKQSQEVNLNINQSKDSKNQSLTLNNSPAKTININEEEQKEIEDFIYSFERFRLEKDVSKIIDSFTPPSTKEEQEALDFMMGKDLPLVNNKVMPRLFITQLFNNFVGTAVIRDISKTENGVTILVDELRITYSGLVEPPGTPDYTATVESLIFELVKTNDGYKIDKYHRQTPNQLTVLKYEGLQS